MAALVVTWAGPAPAQSPRPTPQAPLEAAWEDYRAGRLDEARRLFEAAASGNPRRVEAHTGLGYVALRRGRLAEAAGHFDVALASEPNHRDALVGLALVDERQGRHRSGLARAERVLARFPADAEALALARRLRVVALAPTEEIHLPPTPRAVLDLPMRARGRVLELREESGAYRPLFLKSVNLGAALPGRGPTEFPTDPALYRQWFEQMRECGFSSLRLYTILPPVFYDTLAEFNRGRPDPLRVIHGVWAEEPEDDDYLAPRFVGEFQAEIRRVIDLMHGALDQPHRPGHASGRYRSDVSPWWIATILGREWEAYSVLAFNRRHPGLADYEGRFVRARQASAMERWLAAQTDYAIGYETDRWNAQRAVAWTNWPTLDPLVHPTESTRAEEAAWQRRRGLPMHGLGGRINDEDAVGLDLEKFEATDANQGGLFAVYHAYPYYPDFLVYDPDYRATRDAEGPNAYLGYLEDLARHHRRHPVFVGEVGVPTSREIAHIQPQGWTHGGHNERQQGEIDARLLRTVHDAGLSGAALFAWIDEWFKHNWLVMAYHRPSARNALWLDRQDAEQNYGLLAYRPGAGGPRIVIDGKVGDWRPGDRLLSAPSGAIRALWVTSDESDLLLRLDTDPAAELGYAIAIDVVHAARGDFRFPAGLALRSKVGFEAAVLLDGRSARVVLDDTYDRGAETGEQPRANDTGTYVSPRIRPNAERITRAGEVIPSTVLDIGTLRPGTTDRASPAHDDGAEWMRDPAGGTVELRIPWGLINVTDPSSRSVLSTGHGEPGGYTTTEGLRFAVAAFRVAPAGAANMADGPAVAALPAADASGVVDGLPLYAWPTWEQPTFHTYRKASFEIVREALRQLPDAPRP